MVIYLYKTKTKMCCILSPFAFIMDPYNMNQNVLLFPPIAFPDEPREPVGAYKLVLIRSYKQRHREIWQTLSCFLLRQ